MTKKSLIAITGILAFLYSLEGCRKKDILKTYVSDSPVHYYIPKLNGTRNWSGSFLNYSSNITTDTSSKFSIRRISDSELVINLPARKDTIYYAETNEIYKTISLVGSSHDTGNYYFQMSLTYYYLVDSAVYKDYYTEHHPNHSYSTTISALTLHSP